jgi:hypothetical protein
MQKSSFAINAGSPILPSACEERFSVSLRSSGTRRQNKSNLPNRRTTIPCREVLGQSTSALRLGEGGEGKRPGRRVSFFRAATTVSEKVLLFNLASPFYDETKDDRKRASKSRMKLKHGDYVRVRRLTTRVFRALSNFHFGAYYLLALMLVVAPGYLTTQ